MAWKEYIDLFKSAQKRDCKYRLFLFDGVKHRYFEDQSKYHSDLYKLTDNVLKDIIKLEKESNILIFDRDGDAIFVKTLDETRDNPKHKLNHMGGPSLFNACFWLGDLIHFAVYNNSISEEEFMYIFKNNLKDLNLNYRFHYGTALYETDIFSESLNKLYRGYAIPVLESQIHEKSKTSEIFVEKE